MRLILVLFLTLTVGLSVSSPSQAGLFETKIEKASALAKIEKKYEAKKLLDKAILDDPLDADVHYEAGLVYSQLGMTSDFDLAMKNACKLKPSYCPKVAEPYYSMGFNYLNEGSQSSAIRAFEKAFAYQPAKRSEAINRLFASGKDLLTNENRAGAKNYFSVLTHFSPSHKRQIANLYFDIGKNSSSFEAALKLYKIALSFSPALKDKIEAQVIAKLSSGEVGKAEKKAAKPQVKKLVSNENFKLLYPPDYWELKINEKYIIKDMKAGQETLYIAGPVGFPTIRFVTSFHTGVKAVLRDGREYDLAKKYRLPNGDYDFKLVAYKDGARAMVRFRKK